MKKLFACLLMLALLAPCAPVLAEGADDALPSRFDLRSVDTDGDGVGDRCYVPPVRNQRPFGTCWGFAATGAAEISILGSILDYDPDAWKTIDLSEKQMVYFTHVPLDDPASPQNGEGVVPSGTDAKSLYNTGGIPFLAAAAYAQGIGPSNESANELFEYHGAEKYTIRHWFDGGYNDYSYSDEDDWTIPEEYRFARDYYLTESVLLPCPARDNEAGALAPYEYHPEYNDLIKRQLLKKRGVTVGFCADVSRPDQDLGEIGVYLNNETWAHYTWDDHLSNHAVVIVGWDDDYPKENFLEGHQPPENGAWLVRNSWGSGECDFPDRGDASWGILAQKTDGNGDPVFDENGDPVMVHTGYFWLSYFDKSLVSPESFAFADSIAPEYVDQHDMLQISAVTVKKSAEPARMANVFTAAHTQVLTDVSCMTASVDCTVQYEIRLLCNGFASPEEGVAAASGTAFFPFGGYHRISLESGVFVQKGQAYSVILTVTDASGEYCVNESVAYSGLGMDQKAVINPKESFLFRSGGWEDYRQVTEDMAQTSQSVFGDIAISYDNFPIKAYSNRVAGDVSMSFGVSNENLSTAEGFNTTKVALYFTGPEGIPTGEPEIVWTLLGGSGDLEDAVPQKNNTQLLLTAKRAGTVYLAAGVKDQPAYGTAVLRLDIKTAAPASAFALDPYPVYTGEPVTPAISVRTAQNTILTEGVDYTVEYSDNVLCGAATATVTAIPADPGDPVPAPVTGSFVIVPQQARILSAQASGNALRVAFADQWASGITGYRVEYRAAGSVEWITETVTDGGTELTIAGLDGGVSYEVRVSAYVEAYNAFMETTMPFYGAASDTVTVVRE